MWSAIPSSSYRLEYSPSLYKLEKVYGQSLWSKSIQQHNIIIYMPFSRGLYPKRFTVICAYNLHMGCSRETSPQSWRCKRHTLPTEVSGITLDNHTGRPEGGIWGLMGYEFLPHRVSSSLDNLLIGQSYDLCYCPCQPQNCLRSFILQYIILCTRKEKTNVSHDLVSSALPSSRPRQFSLHQSDCAM